MTIWCRCRCRRSCQPGMRVMVPFGRANRRQEGMVLALDMTEKLGLKSIEQMLDKTPVLSEAFLRLAAFLRDAVFLHLL